MKILTVNKAVDLTLRNRHPYIDTRWSEIQLWEYANSLGGDLTLQEMFGVQPSIIHMLSNLMNSPKPDEIEGAF